MSGSMDVQTQGPIAFGIRRLMVTHPFYATFIDRWRVIEEASVPTLAVRLAPDLRVELLYNRAFALRIAPDELCNVLLHEVHHVLFRHILMSPAAYPDAEALLVAQEVTCNEYIPGPLPGGGLRLKDFGLRPHQSTARRYELLRQALSADTRASMKLLPPSVDCHDAWAGPDAQPDVSPVTLDAVLAADMRTALAALPEGLRRVAAEELGQKLRPHVGRAPGLDVVALEGGGLPRTTWSDVLRSFVWRLRRASPSLGRPPRRLPKLVGVVAGRAASPARPTVLAVLDTSGSMIDAAILRTIRAEVHALHLLAQILVVECDAAIRRVYRYTGAIESVVGGGGTSFAAPLAPEFLAKHRVDAVLYFTDGYGFVPSRRPRKPVVWCLVGDAATRPAPWGKVVRIGTE